MAVGSIFHCEQKRSVRRDLKGYSWPFRGISGRQPMAPKYEQQGTTRMDIVIIGIELLFFAVSLAYIKACDAL